MVKSIFVLIHSWPSLEVMCILSYPSCSTSAATSQTDSQTVRSVTLYLGVVRELFWLGTRQQQCIPIYQDHFVRSTAQRHGSLVPGEFWHFLLSPIQNWCVSTRALAASTSFGRVAQGVVRSFLRSIYLVKFGGQQCWLPRLFLPIITSSKSRCLAPVLQMEWLSNGDNSARFVSFQWFWWLVVGSGRRGSRPMALGYITYMLL